MAVKFQAYISSPLTGLPKEKREQLKAFYEALGVAFESVARELGRTDAVAYIPHQHGDPIKHAHLTPAEILSMDKKHLSESALMIMYTGVASHGVGREHEWALARKIPIIALCETKTIEQRRVSRLARVDVTEELSFTDYDDAVGQLKAALRRIVASL